MHCAVEGSVALGLIGPANDSTVLDSLRGFFHFQSPWPLAWSAMKASLDFRPVFSGTLVGLQVPEVPPQAHMSKRENVGRGLWAA